MDLRLAVEFAQSVRLPLQKVVTKIAKKKINYNESEKLC